MNKNEEKKEVVESGKIKTSEEKRRQKAEDFILNPEKTLFESISEFDKNLEIVQNALEKFPDEVEQIVGENGTTPQRGIDYMSEDDLSMIEDFIDEKIPKEDVDYPSIKTALKMVKKFAKDEVAKIKVPKGEKGEDGKDGKDGKNGSPDTAKNIIQKIRTLGKNQGLKIKDIRGLKNILENHKNKLDEIDILKKAVDKKLVVFGGSGGSENSSGSGLTEAQIDAKIQAIVGNAPDTLNTLEEIVNALNTKEDKLPTTPTNPTNKVLNGNKQWVDMPSGSGGSVDLSNYYTKSETDTITDTKVNKEGTKVLSDNNFSNSEKTKLAGLENYDDTNVNAALAGKVDKATGKVLSDNNFTTAEKNKVTEIDNKVDKVSGKSLSTNDYTTAEKTKLAGLSMKKIVGVLVSDPNGDPLTTGDAKAYIRASSEMNGWKLTGVSAHVTTAPTSGIPTIQIRNLETNVDILSTPLTIDVNEKDSATATTPAVIGTSNTVSTGNAIAIDVDIAGTGTKGLFVELIFEP